MNKKDTACSCFNILQLLTVSRENLIIKMVQYLSKFQNFCWWVWTIGPQEKTQQHQVWPEHTVCLEQAKIKLNLIATDNEQNRNFTCFSAKKTYS